MSEVRSKARIMCKNLICTFADSLVEVKKKPKTEEVKERGRKEKEKGIVQQYP